jgi:hypothetical protein
MLFAVSVAFAQESSGAVAAADAWRAKGCEQKVCGQICFAGQSCTYDHGSIVANR